MTAAPESLCVRITCELQPNGTTWLGTALQWAERSLQGQSKADDTPQGLGQELQRRGQGSARDLSSRQQPPSTPSAGMLHRPLSCFINKPQDMAPSDKQLVCCWVVLDGMMESLVQECEL